MPEWSILKDPGKTGFTYIHTDATAITDPFEGTNGLGYSATNIDLLLPQIPWFRDFNEVNIVRFIVEPFASGLIHAIKEYLQPDNIAEQLLCPLASQPENAKYARIGVGGAYHFYVLPGIHTRDLPDGVRKVPEMENQDIMHPLIRDAGLKAERLGRKP